MNPNEKIPRSSSNDLKFQLGELQRKFAPQNVRASRSQAQPQIHLPPIAPQKQQQQPIVNTTSKTVDFLGDLSDGLLLESRRLAHENNIFKSKLSKLDQENSNLKKQLNNLTTVFETSNEREEQLNDEKWELQIKLKNLEKTHERSILELKNYKLSQSTSIESADKLKSSLDTLKSERDQLEDALNSQITSLKSELTELKDSNENLNDENDLLHQNFISLKSDFDSMKTEKEHLLAQLAESDSETDDEFNQTFDDSILTDPQPLQQINSLDKETLQRNLNHAYSIIKKLRVKNLKLKSPRKSPIKSNLDNWGDDEIEDSFEKNAIPDLAMSDSDSDDEFKGLVTSSPVKSSVVVPPNGDFVIIVPSNLSANDVLSNIDSYKSIPVNKSEFRVLSSITTQEHTSPIKFNPKAITSSKYSDNNMVKLVTLDELNDLKDILKEKDLEIQHLKAVGVSSASTAANVASSVGVAGASVFGAAAGVASGAAGLALAGGLKLVSNDRDNKSIPLETHQRLLNDHKTLKAKIDEPDLAYLKSMVSKRGLITLPEVEFSDLKNSVIERDSLKLQVNEKNSKLQSFEFNVNELNNELKSLKTQINDKETGLMKLESQINEKDVQLKSLQSQVGERDSQLRSMKSEIGEIGTKLMIFESQIVDKDSKLDLLQSQLVEGESTVTSLKSQIVEKTTQLESLQLQINEKDAKLMELTSQIDQHVSSVDSLKLNVSERDDKLKSLQLQIDSPDADYIKSKSSGHGLVAIPVVEHDSLKNKLSDSNDKLSALEAQMVEKDVQLESVQSQVTEKSKQLESIQIQIAEKDTTLESLETQINEKVTELQLLQSHVTDRETELKSLQSQIYSPDVDYIKSKSTSHGLIAVPIVEHESLKTQLSENSTQLKSLQSQIDSPDADYIKSKSSGHGLVAVPMVDHESMKTDLSNKEAQLKSLQTKLDSPSLDFIQSKSSLHGIIPLPIVVHDSLKKEIKDKDSQLELLKAQIDSPDIEYVKSKTTDHGFIAVPIVQHDSMKLELTQLTGQLDELNQYKSSIDKELDEKREKIVEMELQLANLKTVESDLQLLQTEKDAIDQKVSTLQEENVKLIEVSKLLDSKKIEFEQLKAELKEPSLDYIKSKASLHNIIPITVDEHEAMQKEISETKSQIKSLSTQIISLETSKSDLESKHIEKDQNIESIKSELELKINHLTDLQCQLDSPSVDYIKSKSSVHGLISVPMVEHESLKGQLKSHQDEIVSLKSTMDNPTVEYIKNKSTTHGLTVLPIADHQSLNDQLNTLKSSIETPDVDYIKSKASLHDLIAVPMVEHESTQKEIGQLKQSIETPDLSYIESKAKFHGFIPIPITDHSSLKSELKSKSDKLTSIAKELDSKHSEIESLLLEKSQVETKLNSLEAIESQFADIQTQLASKEKELNGLQLKFDNPTEDYIKSMSSFHGLVSIPIDHHTSLTTQIKDNKSELNKMETEIIALRKVKEDLELQGIKSVSMELHDSVQTELAETQEKSNEISRKLEIVNAELNLRDDKINKLQIESNELALKSEKLNQVENELSSLKNEKSDLEAKHKEFLELQTVHDDLIKKVDVLKNVEVELESVKSELQYKNSDLLNLQQSIDKPTADYIKTKSKELGLISIPDKDHEALKYDLESKLKEIEQLQSVKSELESHKLELGNLNVVNTNLQSKIDELKLVESQLIDMRSTLESKELDLASVNKLLESPSIDYIKSKSEYHGLVAIPMTEHTNSIDELHSLKDIVEMKEKELAGLKVSKYNLDIEKSELVSQITELENDGLKLADNLSLRESKLAEYKSQIETPTSEYIKSKSELHGLVSIPVEDYNSTKYDLESFKNLAGDRERELTDLKSSLETVTVERDDLTSQINELRVKSTKDLEAMKGLYENPSSDYLKLKASKIGLTLLAIAEFQSLNSKLSGLTSELNQKSQAIESLQSKVSTLETPSKEYIHTRSTAMGFIPIPIFEHKNLTSDVESKKKIINDLEISNNQLSKELHQLKETHESLLTQKDSTISSLQNQIDEPNIDYVQSKSLNHGLITIPTVEHDALIKDIENHKTQLVSKSRELNDHKVQLEEKHKEISALQMAEGDSIKKISETEDELTKLKDQLDDRHKEVETLTTQHGDLSKNIELLEVKLAALLEKNESDLSENEKNVQLLKDQLDGKHKEVEALATQHDDSSKRVNDLEAELASLNTKLQVELSDNEINIESLKVELSDKSNIIEKLQREFEEPTADYVKSKSTLHGLVPLSTQEYNKLQSDLEEHKAELVSLGIVKEQLESKHGELEAHINELNDVKVQLGDKDKEIESLEMTKTDSLQRVGVLELELSSLNTKLATDLNESNKVIESLKGELESNAIIIDKLQKELQEPSIEYVKSKSAVHGFVPIPIVDHTGFTTKINNGEAQIILLQSKLDNTIQELEDFRQHNATKSGEVQQAHTAELHEKEQVIGELESRLDDVKAQLENVQIQLENVEDTSDEEIDDAKLEQQALDRGFALLPIPQHKEIASNAMEKTSSLATITQDAVKIPQSTMTVILETMDQNGFKCIPIDEYDELISRPDLYAHGDITIDEDDLANATLEADQIKSQLESKRGELNKLELRSRRSSFISVSSGSSTVSVNDLLHSKELLIQKKKDSIIETIKALEKKRGDIQKQINRVSVASFDSEMTSNTGLNNRLDKKLATIKDKIELANIELNSQQSALTAVQEYIKSAKDMKLAPIKTQSSYTTANDSTSIHTLDGMAVLKNDIVELESKYNSKIEELEELRQHVDKSPKEMITQLTSLGYVVNKKSSEGGVELKPVASTISLATTNASEYFDAESYITESGAAIEPELKSRAAELGLALIPVTEVNKYQATVAKVEGNEFEDLQWKSHELGYELVKIEELDNLKKMAQELPESLNIVDLQMYANKLDLKLLSGEDIQQLKKRPVTSKELATKAGELKLIMLTEKEAAELEAKRPITADNLSEKAKAMGLLCIPVSQYIATTVAKECDVTTAVVLSNTYYKKLLKSHDFFKKNNRATVDTIVPPPIPEESAYVPTTPTMSVSNIDATSLHTVNTVISNKQEIIAAVAQTIIGEYLYKYYRKLGPLSSIADSRHERYFWIHPYSLTIYWSVNNPVLTDPGKTQIKAMSIVSVHSVDDNNPLPPGIYHKSIIIKSHDRSIKLTCPTRQRHNIWFNSLKYLIEKSTENWVNDDDVEDQYTQTFQMDKRIELDRNQSMSFRHSQPRNVSFKSLENRRISSVPSMRNSLRN